MSPLPRRIKKILFVVVKDVVMSFEQEKYWLKCKRTPFYDVAIAVFFIDDIFFSSAMVRNSIPLSIISADAQRPNIHIDMVGISFFVSKEIFAAFNFVYVRNSFDARWLVR